MGEALFRRAATRQARGELARANSDESGRYRLAGVSGDFVLRFVGRTDPATGAGPLDAYWPGVHARRSATILSASALSAGGFDVRMVEAGSISGRVTDAAGTALQQVTVRWAVDGGEALAYTYSVTEDGRYVFRGLEPGRYEIQVEDQTRDHASSWYGGALRSQSTGIVVGEGTDVTGIDLALADGAALTGDLRAPGFPDWSAYPNESLRVSAIDADGITAGSASVDSTADSGRYEIRGLSAGGFTLFFSSAGGRYLDHYWPHAATEAASTPVTTRAGSATSGIDADYVLGAR